MLWIPSLSFAFMFRGSKRTFSFEFQLMDSVTEIHLEHRAVGMSVSRDWGLQHVEICHEGTGRSFYFLAGVASIIPCR